MCTGSPLHSRCSACVYSRMAPHRLVDRLAGFLQEQRIAGADRDRRASRRHLVERRHRHRGGRRVPEIGADRGRHQLRARRLQRERHAGGDRLAIAEMLGHPQALGAGRDRALRQLDRLAGRDEAVEAHSHPHRHCLSPPFRSGCQRSVVMAGLVPAIHVLLLAQKTWMPATSAGMTAEQHEPDMHLTDPYQLVVRRDRAGDRLESGRRDAVHVLDVEAHAARASCRAAPSCR